MVFTIEIGLQNCYSNWFGRVIMLKPIIRS